MSEDKKTTSTPVVIDQKEHAAPVVIEQNKEHAEPHNKASHGISSQAQLLHLAKRFRLDGALRPIEKQAPVEDRFEQRERFNQLRQQENIETIIEKSLAYCAHKQVADKADLDWFESYVALAEHISNPTMQELWAKILAREVARPGSFSMKTLKVFRELSLSDAKLFGKACQLAVKDNSKRNIRIISGCYQQPGLLNIWNKNRAHHMPLSQFGLGYGEILTLADNHLLFAQEAELQPMQAGDELAFKYNGKPLIVSARKNRSVIQFYKFTPIAAELARLIADKPDEEFLSTMKASLGNHFNCRE